MHRGLAGRYYCYQHTFTVACYWHMLLVHWQNTRFLWFFMIKFAICENSFCLLPNGMVVHEKYKLKHVAYIYVGFEKGEFAFHLSLALYGTCDRVGLGSYYWGRIIILHLIYLWWMNIASIHSFGETKFPTWWPIVLAHVANLDKKNHSVIVIMKQKIIIIHLLETFIKFSFTTSNEESLRFLRSHKWVILSIKWNFSESNEKLLSERIIGYSSSTDSNSRNEKRINWCHLQTFETKS